MINVMNILLLLWKGGNGNKERIQISQQITLKANIVF